MALFFSLPSNDVLSVPKNLHPNDLIDSSLSPKYYLRHFCSHTLKAILLLMLSWQNYYQNRPWIYFTLKLANCAFIRLYWITVAIKKGQLDLTESRLITSATMCVLDNHLLVSPFLPTPTFYYKMFKPTDILKEFHSEIHIYLPPGCYNEHFGTFLYHKSITLFM